MSGTDWMVVLGAVLAIGAVYWWFFVAGQKPAAASAEVVITVDGGYSPSVVQATVGKPLRLIFDRKDNSSCSEEIVIPEFNVRRYLPTGERTVIEVTPTRAGKFTMSCGMNMLHGSIIANV
jgi:plastocyanin domain-containing protein